MVVVIFVLCRHHPTMITLSSTLQAPRNILREFLPSDPEPALKPGQALDHPVCVHLSCTPSQGPCDGKRLTENALPPELNN